MTVGRRNHEDIAASFVARATGEPDRLIARHKYRGIWREFRYGDVLERVRNLALGLQSMPFARGETVAIIGENEPENFWVELAVLAIGGKVVSLYPDLTVGEIEYLLNDSQAVYLVGQDQEQVDKGLAMLGNVPTLRRLIYWDDTGMWSYRQPSLMKLDLVEDAGRKRNIAEPGLFESLLELGKPDDIAILSYTSGTTGRPKGVVLTHRYLIDNAHRLVSGTDAAGHGLPYLPRASLGHRTIVWHNDRRHIAVGCKLSGIAGAGSGQSPRTRCRGHDVRAPTMGEPGVHDPGRMLDAGRSATDL